MIDTNSFTEKYRISKYNGLKGFSECEVCGAREPLESVNIRYCHRARKIICDRCIDNYDGVTPWTGKQAKERGLPLFPMGR